VTSMKVMARWWSGVFVVALLAVGAVTSSCGTGIGGDNSSPTAPTSQTVPNLTGTWTGTTFSNSTGLTFSAGVTFFQTGSALSGTWYAGGGTTGGTISGTVNSSGGVSFTTTPSNPLTCPLSVTAIVAGSTLGGTWATTGCTEAITGTLSLTKGGGGVPPTTAWSRTGTGATIMDLPTRITHIRIEGEYNGQQVMNFIVWCGSGDDLGGLLVNEILGTHSGYSTTYSGIHSALRSYSTAGQPCGELEVTYSSGLQWSITETAPRSGLSETAPRSGLSPAATTGSLAGDVDAVQRLRRQATTTRE